MSEAIEHRSGSTKLACGVEDPKRRAWCVREPGHEGKHQDGWGKTFDGAPKGRLADLPRFLRAGGSRTLAKIVAEELAKYEAAQRVLGAVLHQMEHGEASDFINGEIGNHVFEDSRRDLLWCRNEVKNVIKSLS
jgi:hypothetical protein